MTQLRWWHKFMPKGSRWYQRALTEEANIKREYEARRRQLAKRVQIIEAVLENRKRRA